MNRIRSDCSREGSRPKPEPAERGTPLPPLGFAGTGDGEDREDEDSGDEGKSVSPACNRTGPRVGPDPRS